VIRRGKIGIERLIAGGEGKLEKELEGMVEESTQATELNKESLEMDWSRQGLVEDWA
ncbi:hypothetical protein U1Q18_049186, partial [Sarracenia purpurea var. burkii]